MSEDAELQAKIAAIAGQINQHKQNQQQTTFTPNPQYHQALQYASHSYYPRGRWSPYGRGGRAGYQPHTNRTLVLSGTQQSPPSPAPETTSSTLAVQVNENTQAGSLVFTRAAGRKQLMNKETYAREQKQLLEHRQAARAAKRQKVDEAERSTLANHMNASSNAGNRQLLINGIPFQLRDDGSKLLRVFDASTNSRETPQKFKIAEVNFCRTKNGNMVRVNAVRDLTRYYGKSRFDLRDQHLLCTRCRTANRKAKPQCEHFTKHGTNPPFSYIHGLGPGPIHPKADKVPRSSLTTVLGSCPFGPTCKFSHEPNKVAMCKTFLKTGSCSAGDSCDLSHQPTYHRVPACTHFLRGNCTNDSCPYPHVKVNDNAPVCRSFSTLFYCPLGAECSKRHLFVCADYANHGKCDNAKCSLPHPDHASALRKAAAKQAKLGSEDASDISSDEDMQGDDTGMEDIDSDEAEDVIMGGGDTDHALTQQQDYVPFS